MGDKGYCPWCGAEVEDEGATYCGACGRPLRAGGSAEPAPASAAEAGGETQVGPRQAQAPAAAGAGQRWPSWAKVAIGISCAAIAAGLTIGGIALSRVGSEAGEAQGPASTAQQEAAVAEGENDVGAGDASESGDGAGSDGATGTSESSGGGEAGGQSDEGSSDQERVIASLDGWWTTVGDRPYNNYVHYDGGTVTTYSSEGEVLATWVLDVTVSATTGEEANFGPWKLMANGGNADQFSILSEDANTLYECWVEGSRVQYSMSDSLIRCGEGQSDPLPSFAGGAASSEADGSGGADTSAGFESVVPQITGWEEQPVPGAPQTSGVIWRVSWSPVDGAEGYEVRNWSQEGIELSEYPSKTVTTAYCDLSGSGVSAFAAQVRAYRTEGGARVYTQWSARSEQQVD